MDESFDDQLCIVSLTKEYAYEVVSGQRKEFFLGYSIPRDYLKQHSYICIASRSKAAWWDPRKDQIFVTEQGILGMAEVLDCQKTFPYTKSYKYILGNAHFVYPFFAYKQNKALCLAPLEVRDRFLEHTRYEVW